MPFCRKCGSPIGDFKKFCKNCGASVGTSQRPQTSQPAPAHVVIPQQQQPVNVAYGNLPGMPGTNRNPIFYAITAVLVFALIAISVFYGFGVNKLSISNNRITALEVNVTSLEEQLTIEKANATRLETQLAITNFDLVASQAKAASLTTDLAASIAKVTATQASLNRANLDLAAALTNDTTQAATLKKIQDPRHFDSLAELTNWLAKDDTNTNPAYSTYSDYSKAFVLQVKALRDGYLLPACLDWDLTYIYSWNVAVVEGTVYSIDPTTDAITQGPTFGNPPPSHPLPLP